MNIVILSNLFGPSVYVPDIYFTGIIGVIYIFAICSAFNPPNYGLAEITDFTVFCLISGLLLLPQMGCVMCAYCEIYKCLFTSHLM